MATCEFHDIYRDYLTDRVATELIGKGDREIRDWGGVWCVVKTIAICKTLEQITPSEAENLTSVIFKLYPQFEEKIREELNQRFG
jgi:hypothetical protein